MTHLASPSAFGFGGSFSTSALRTRCGLPRDQSTHTGAWQALGRLESLAEASGKSCSEGRSGEPDHHRVHCLVFLGVCFCKCQTHANRNNFLPFTHCGGIFRSPPSWHSGWFLVIENNVVVDAPVLQTHPSHAAPKEENSSPSPHIFPIHQNLAPGVKEAVQQRPPLPPPPPPPVATKRSE
ncbi:hypothetical protein ZHAS_00018154 [Anopheles sinensis]|uniref:Uncharacterized protein n=1 Tax=Anopheles sinensis TaxID=74873 RepID=A0A084WIQ7_ANOSI|nr:hypothetical protein ZHAS_00018154 [Anopheles sinensis]